MLVSALGLRSQFFALFSAALLVPLLGLKQHLHGRRVVRNGLKQLVNGEVRGRLLFIGFLALLSLSLLYLLLQLRRLGRSRGSEALLVPVFLFLHRNVLLFFLFFSFLFLAIPNIVRNDHFWLVFLHLPVC